MPSGISQVPANPWRAGDILPPPHWLQQPFPLPFPGIFRCQTRGGDSRALRGRSPLQRRSQSCSRSRAGSSREAGGWRGPLAGSGLAALRWHRALHLHKQLGTLRLSETAETELKSNEGASRYPLLRAEWDASLPGPRESTFLLFPQGNDVVPSLQWYHHQTSKMKTANSPKGCKMCMLKQRAQDTPGRAKVNG